MRQVLLCALVLLVTVRSEHQREDKEEEKEVEREIHEAFKAAFSNRSDEIQDFFNKTFGPGGNASDIAERFKQAWGSTSEGVKRFVNDTYWNISRIMTANDTDKAVATTASLGYDDITARINNYQASSPEPGKEKVPAKPKPDSHHGGILDTAWNYFKSVFGVNPKPTTAPHKSVPNTVPPPSAASASIPSTSPVVPHQGGLYVGIITMFAALFVLLQAMFNRNSLVNKQVATPSSKSSIRSRNSQVPSGYVRIA